MINTSNWMQWLAESGSRAPAMAACLLACCVVWFRRREWSRGVYWALAGFLLALLHMILMPVVYRLAIHMVSSHGGHSPTQYLFLGLNFVSSVVVGASYLCLLAALLNTHAAPPPPPMHQPRD